MNNEKYLLPSHWKEFTCTRENLRLVWENLNQFPILFDDSVRGDQEHFLREMIDPNSIIILTGDYGILRVNNIIPYRDCQIHLAFWDRKFKGRFDECKQTLLWLFDKFKLHRATIEIPSIAYSTIKFIKALGFKKEGEIRDGWCVNGKFMNLSIFGITEEEVFSDKNIDNNNEEVKENGFKAENESLSSNVSF